MATTDPRAHVADKCWVGWLPLKVSAELSKDALWCLQTSHPYQLEAPPLRALHQSLHQPLLYPLWLHSNQGLLLGPGRPYSTRAHQQASKGWPHNLQTTFEGKKVEGKMKCKWLLKAVLCTHPV